MGFNLNMLLKYKKIILISIIIILVIFGFFIYRFFKNQVVKNELPINYKIYQNSDGLYVEYPNWVEYEIENLEKIYPKEMIEKMKSNIIIMASDSRGAQLTISKKIYDSSANIKSVAEALEEDRRRLLQDFKILDKQISENEINMKSSFRLFGFKILSFSKGFLVKGLEESNIFYNVEISVIKDKVDDYQSIINHVFSSEKVKNIIIFTPGDNQKVKSPILVKGRARVFESNVSIRLKDSDGKILFEGNAIAQAPDVGLMGDFKKEISFVSDKDNGVLEVFWISPKDGSELDKIIIPLEFR